MFPKASPFRNCRISASPGSGVDENQGLGVEWHEIVSCKARLTLRPKPQHRGYAAVIVLVDHPRITHNVLLARLSPLRKISDGVQEPTHRRWDSNAGLVSVVNA